MAEGNQPKYYAEEIEKDTRYRQDYVDGVNRFFDEQYSKMAEQYGVEIDRVKAAIPSSEVEKDIAVNKAVDLVKDNAVITDAQPEPKEEKPAAKKTAAKKTTAKKAEEKSEEKTEE